MSDKSPEQIEIERLRASNAELLGEAKAAKNEAKRLAGELEEAQAATKRAQDALQGATVGRPVREMLARISTSPDVLEILLERHGYRFEEVEGSIVIRDKDGNTPKLWPRGEGQAQGREREATFTAEDLSTLLCEEWSPWAERSETAKTFAAVIKSAEVSGGGALNPGQRPPTATEPAQPPAQPPAQYGIR